MMVSPTFHIGEFYILSPGKADSTAINQKISQDLYQITIFQFLGSAPDRPGSWGCLVGREKPSDLTRSLNNEGNMVYKSGAFKCRLQHFFVAMINETVDHSPPHILVRPFFMKFGDFLL